jgi:hypothetical protein
MVTPPEPKELDETGGETKNLDAALRRKMSAEGG